MHPGQRSGPSCRWRPAGDRARAGSRLRGRKLVLLSWSALRRGHWSLAVPAADEGGRHCAETGQPFWQACALAARAYIAAHQGEVDTAERLIAAADAVAGPHHFAAADAVILIARAALAAARGEHQQGFHHLARLHDPTDSAHHPVHGLWSLASLADAALTSGHTDAARRVLAGLRPDVRATRSPAGRINLLYAEAVLAPSAEAGARTAEALAAIPTEWPIERNRLLLTRGRWLRRHKNAREAREHLRQARDGFDRLGARPWADQARAELRAAGERSEPPTVDNWDHLSPQEAQIAGMVAQGLSNRQIGDRLFISHRTVGAHLYHLFPKLGINTRAELARPRHRAPADSAPGTRVRRPGPHCDLTHLRRPAHRRRAARRHRGPQLTHSRSDVGRARAEPGFDRKPDGFLW